MRASRVAGVFLFAALAAATCDDPVDPPFGGTPPDRLTLSPTGATSHGVGTRFAFEVLDEDGRPIDGRRVTWSSLNPAVATIDEATGEAVAVASGQAVIAAEVEGVPGYALLTVTADAAPVREWRLERAPTPPLTGVWGTSDSDVFFVGRLGAILHYDGSTLEDMASPTSGALYAVAGTSSSDVWAVGHGGDVLHYDGSTWSRITSGLLLDVWAISPTDAWAVGAYGAVHYDGESWSSVETGTDATLRSVWGSSSTDVFAVGDDGTIVHNDGSGWSAMASGTTVGLQSVWGSGPDDVYAVGPRAVLHFDGAAWSRVEVGDSGFYAVGGSGPDDVWVAGGSLAYHYDGTTWSPDPPPGVMEFVGDLWVSDSGTAYAVDSNGTAAMRDSSGWTLLREGGDAPGLVALWGAGPDDVFGGGGGRVFQRRPDGHWVVGWEVGNTVQDLWGTSGSDVYAVGIGYDGMHYDGQRWATVDADVEWPVRMAGVWGAAPDDVWFFYDGGALHHSPEGWQFDVAGLPALYDAWGTATDDIFALADRGIYHYDGSWWHSMLGASFPLRYAVWGTSPTDVFVVGDEILHYDGSEWTPMDSPYDGVLRAVCGTAPDDVFAAGRGTILHYDGTAWSIVFQSDLPAMHFRALWTTSTGDVYAVGLDGLSVVGER